MDGSTSNFDSDITHNMHIIDVATDSLSESFQSLKSKSQQTSQNQVQLQNVKSKLKEVEDELVEVLAEKTRKEAKRMALMNAIASAKARVGNLNTSIEEVRARKQEFTEFLSQQSLDLAASEEKLNESIEHTNETREAISWYNRVLGFHVKGGRGVKFTFKNINLKNPNEEYTFIVLHDKNTYTLLSCEPHVNGIEELVDELNKTNGLFKFVKAMRKKFQETLVQGSLVLTTVEPGESAFISSSAPGTSIRGDSTTTENEHQVELSDGSAQLKKKNSRRRKSVALLSPVSASSVRKSPRFKARK
ncbi:kinetochore protein SPC25 homolog [Vicia villosa]|uniref:kinetochore protein SPC25 homolog n=1 Tax=Vicia villosa TaxID=3911 RepID=UPI00273B03D5|nr:kinetochore protein SPC25 homolog [Vicia villosa]